MGNLSFLDYVALILVAVGGLNWGFVGVFDFNLVTAVFGMYPIAEKIVYGLIGLSAVYLFYLLLGRRST